MGLRARILRMVADDCGGPRSKNVLKGLARTKRQKATFERVFKAMRRARELVMYRKRKHALYGLPPQPALTARALVDAINEAYKDGVRVVIA